MSSPKDTNEGDDKIEVNFDESKKVLNLSKAQLKALGLQYKAPQTEAQLKRNQKLSEMSKARHDKQRREREAYEREQIENLQKKLVVEPKPKQKYNKKTIPVSVNSSDDSSDSDDEDVKEYQEFMKFKKAKAKTTKPAKKPKEVVKDESSSDDEMIQKKTAKATKIIETVNKLDNAINKMSVGNPYLDLFNKGKK